MAAPSDDRDTLSALQPELGSAPRVPTLTILFHPDLDRVGETTHLATLPADLSRATPVFSGSGRPLDDPYLSRSPMHLDAYGDGGVRLQPDEAAVVVDGTQVSGAVAFGQPALDRGVVLELAQRVVLLLHRARAPQPELSRDLGFIGQNDAMVDLRRSIERVADLDVPVLIRGETGTGKELVARAVHAASGRAGRPFISVNMSAIPPSTAASELFGHRRGAFTGAMNDRQGYFARAADGTLFLDEIGATPSEVQPMLLRALELHEIQPLGGAPIRVAPRFVAATDANLEQAIQDSSFRAALLHRLESFQLLVPPLRVRRDDIGRLFVHFLRAELGTTGETERLEAPLDGATWVPASLVGRLARLGWPGNVRQLRNLVRQLVISSRGADRVVIDAAVSRLLESAEATAPTPRPAVEASEISEEALIEALRRHDWRANAAARHLGLSRSAMYERIKKSSRIRTAESLTREEIEAAREEQGGDLTAMARALEVSRRALQLRMGRLGL